MSFKRQSFFIILFLQFFVTIAAYAHTPQDVNSLIKDVEFSIRENDAERMSKYFDYTIDITLESTHRSYSRDHAKILLNDFLEKSKPKSFKIEYKGNSLIADAQYVVGTMVVKNENVKVFLLLKKEGQKYVIQELKFGN